MRASRLISILLLLQARGRMTADALAAELEVSTRTIYRDVEALQAAGVPLYGNAGHDGGYRLVEGYRTRLTGLTGAEAEALPLVALPAAAADLGLAAAAAAAAAKLKAALAPDLRERADRVERRLFVDPPSWYADAGGGPHLAVVADAVWRERRIEVVYRRWAEPCEVSRTLDPLGLVLKAGRWYLVATGGRHVTTYRVANLLTVTATEATFTRPAGFDLPAYWNSYLADFDRRRLRGTAVVRLSQPGRERLAAVMEPAVTRAVAETGRPDPDGWIRARIPIESPEHAHDKLILLGADVEVLQPARLRHLLADTAARIARLYAGAPVRGGRA